MKKFLSLLSALILSVSVFAQISFKTDDAQFDADLNSVNGNAKLDLKLFNKNLSIEYGVPEKKVEEMNTVNKMEPAEVFLALELAKLSKKKLDDVLAVYKTDKDKGWGYIAKQMGIKPGSAEFHALKDASKNKKNNGKGNDKAKGNGKSKAKSK